MIYEISYNIPRQRVLLDGAVVRYLRKERGLTSKQLADKVGISHGSLSNYERMESAPLKSVAQKIAEALAVQVGTIKAKWRHVESGAEVARVAKNQRQRPEQPAEEITLFNVEEIDQKPQKGAEYVDGLRYALQRVEKYIGAYRPHNNHEHASGALVALKLVYVDLFDEIKEKGGER
jgi:transcriptional regulator with XRE-family HTH domain|nr:MAG TPA: helix-turn-helix domain protein [Caudoviricetes sp.]